MSSLPAFSFPKLTNGYTTRMNTKDTFRVLFGDNCYTSRRTVEDKHQWIDEQFSYRAAVMYLQHELNFITPSTSK
jgi:hypothetical protein